MLLWAGGLKQSVRGVEHYAGLVLANVVTVFLQVLLVLVFAVMFTK